MTSTIGCWEVALLLEPRDLWIGLFWRTAPDYSLELFFCPLPCVLIRARRPRVSLERVRMAVLKVMDDHGLPGALEILDCFGVESVADLKPHHYPLVVRACEARSPR